jgi:hypothetical protein
MTLDQDRERGILSPADRRYLQDSEAYSDQAAYERREAIKTRVREGLLDFSMLLSHLDADSRKEIFDGVDDFSVYPGVFAYLYLGITDTAEPPDFAKDHFEEMVRQGVRDACTARGVSVRAVDVNVEVDMGEPIDELEDMPLADLSVDQARQLLDEEGISREDYNDRRALDLIQQAKDGYQSGRPEQQSDNN